MKSFAFITTTAATLLATAAAAVTLDVPAEASGIIQVGTYDANSPLCSLGPCTRNDVGVSGPASIEPTATVLDEVVFRISAPPGQHFAIKAPDAGHNQLFGGFDYATGSSFADNYQPDSMSVSFTNSFGTEPGNLSVSPTFREAGNQIAAYFSLDIDGDFRFDSLLLKVTGQIPALMTSYSPLEGDGAYFYGYSNTELSDPEFIFVEGSLAAVPLPPAAALLIGGLAALAWAGRRRTV